MNTDDVWVVFNTQQNKILHVYALESMADAKATWYWTSEDAPKTGTMDNIYKIDVVTLTDAITAITDNK